MIKKKIKNKKNIFRRFFFLEFLSSKLDFLSYSELSKKLYLCACRRNETVLKRLAIWSGEGTSRSPPPIRTSCQTWQTLIADEATYPRFAGSMRNVFSPRSTIKRETTKRFPGSLPSATM